MNFIFDGWQPKTSGITKPPNCDSGVQKPNPDFIPPASGAYSPPFRKPVPMPEINTVRQPSKYEHTIKNPHYKRCIEIRMCQDGVWDVFIDGSWACSRSARENVISEVSDIMKEIAYIETDI